MSSFLCTNKKTKKNFFSKIFGVCFLSFLFCWLFINEGVINGIFYGIHYWPWNFIRFFCVQNFCHFSFLIQIAGNKNGNFITFFVLLNFDSFENRKKKTNKNISVCCIHLRSEYSHSYVRCVWMERIVFVLRQFVLQLLAHEKKNYRCPVGIEFWMIEIIKSMSINRIVIHSPL